MDDEEKALILNEIIILKEINHPFKLKYVDDFIFNDNFCIVTEFYS
jgi:serine/threonine protein kinase